MEFKMVMVIDEIKQSCKHVEWIKEHYDMEWKMETFPIHELTSDLVILHFSLIDRHMELEY